MANGLWINGKHSTFEIGHLQDLIVTAARECERGKPWKHEDEKITMTANKTGTELHIYYSWKYPPPNLWCQGERDKKIECAICLPQGEKGNGGREVWCEHEGYDFPKCPYGCITKKGEKTIYYDYIYSEKE